MSIQPAALIAKKQRFAVNGGADTTAASDVQLSLPTKTYKKSDNPIETDLDPGEDFVVFDADSVSAIATEFDYALISNCGGADLQINIEVDGGTIEEVVLPPIRLQGGISTTVDGHIGNDGEINSNPDAIAGRVTKVVVSNPAGASASGRVEAFVFAEVTA